MVRVEFANRSAGLFHSIVGAANSGCPGFSPNTYHIVDGEGRHSGQDKSQNPGFPEQSYRLEYRFGV